MMMLKVVLMVILAAAVVVQAMDPNDTAPATPDGDFKLSLLKQLSHKRNNKITYDCGDEYLSRHCECKLEPILNTLHVNCDTFLPVNYTVVPQILLDRRTTADLPPDHGQPKPINGIYIRNAYSSWPSIESVYENIYFLSITNGNLTGELGQYVSGQNSSGVNSLKNLVKLILNNNNLSRINRTYFCRLVSLEHLDLSYNKFEVVNFEDFVCLENDKRVEVDESENESSLTEHDLSDLNKRSSSSSSVSGSNIFRLKRIYLNNNQHTDRNIN